MRVIQALTFGFMLSAVAVQAADAPLTVDEIVQKNIAARGGLDKIHAIQTMRLVGMAEINGQVQAEMTLVTKRPNLFRLEMMLPQGTLVRGFDGTDAWAITPGGAAPQKQSQTESQNSRDNADIDGPLVDYKTKGTTVQLLGSDDVAGSPAYKLKVTTKGGTSSTVWIDKQTWYESKLTQTVMQNGAPVQVDSLFSNFKPVNGVMEPMARDQQMGSMRMKISFVSSEANVPLEDSVFRMPPAAAPEAPSSGRGR